jgi:putative spermidine/putrescine transport system ATP-binding protein
MDFSHSQRQSFLHLRSISHTYGQKTVLQDVSLEVRKSEVLALLGPSGSGKSTLLSVLAGIVTPARGECFLDGQDISRLSAEMRGLGMVFQDFALWPHMTVAENVGFPLRVRKFARAEIIRRTEEALMRVGLEGFKSRRPQQLSGGQQQRVALARAVVAETRLLLLDEPLSALDPATRANVRGELADILRKLDLTTIIVTHDREEAFELADRIAILIDGTIQQHARPEDTYERPANLAVARFMGANLLSVQLRRNGRAALNDGSRSQLQLNGVAFEGLVHLAIVPEQSRVVDSRSNGVNVLQAQVLRTQYRGGEYRLQVKIGNAEFGQIIEVRSKEPPTGNSVLIHLPAEAIHVIQEPTHAPTPSAAIQPSTNCNLAKLQEELA